MQVNRYFLDLPYSLFKFLRTQTYTVDITTATLLQHHSGLQIVHAYPDDITALKVPTLALSTPMAATEDGNLFGTVSGINGDPDVFSLEIYGFVVGRSGDHASKTYRDKLMNDVYNLLKRMPIPLYSQAAGSGGITTGTVEIIGLRARSLPVNIPEIEADRFKFIIE